MHLEALRHNASLPQEVVGKSRVSNLVSHFYSLAPESSYLRNEVAAAMKEGRSNNTVLAATLPALTERYGKWNFVEEFAKADILNTAAELRGDKKVPQTEPDAATTKDP
jgi:hypothetical protein